MFQVQILGTSSAIPTRSRYPSAQVVTYHDRHHLVDCGEGTQMQLLRYQVKLARLDAIFISHLHGDHMLGLPGLLNTLGMYGRNFPLTLFAPAALQQVLEVIFEQTQSYLPYELNFVPLEDFLPGAVIWETPQLIVQVIPLEHRIFCRGFRFTEHNKRPKFNFFQAKSLGVPNPYFHLLKQGNAVTLENGQVVTPEMVLQDPDPPLSYAYCSDTRYQESLVEYIRESTLLYHEATFTEEFKERAAETWHSTSRDAANIARLAEVKHLLLGHYSARYRDLGPLLQEACEVFPQTELALEGNVFNLTEYV